MLIKNATLISMNPSKDIIEYNMDVLIEGNIIKNIDRNIMYDGEVIDANGMVLMPGLVNTHSHVPMSIFRETLDGYDLQDWLKNKIWPIEDNLTEEDIYYGAYISFLEAIRTGTTCVNDMYFQTHKIIEAANKCGVRLQTSRTLMGSINNESDLNRFKEQDELINKYKSDMVSFNAGIHGFYTSEDSYIDECIKYVDKNKLPIHIHFCENRQEVIDIKNMHHKDPVDLLKDKFNDRKVLLAHSVKLTDEDIDKLSKMNNISISHCPISNLKLGCGVANISKMLSCGINISLGTDGQGSGSNMDLFEVMKITPLLQKGINENPKLIDSYEVLKMSTINGAKALNLDKEIGSIEIGKKADLILIDIDNNIKAAPVNNLIPEIIYNVTGFDVDTTIIDGKILMRNKVILNQNIKEIISKCKRIDI